MIPHIGWNALHFRNDDPLFKYIKEGDYVYFVHSYYAEMGPHTLGITEYAGVEFSSAVRRGNLVATQFHPEKSGRLGLSLLRSFLR